jgi:hypothetical protein
MSVAVRPRGNNVIGYGIRPSSKLTIVSMACGKLPVSRIRRRETLADNPDGVSARSGCAGVIIQWPEGPQLSPARPRNGSVHQPEIHINYKFSIKFLVLARPSFPTHVRMNLVHCVSCVTLPVGRRNTSRSKCENRLGNETWLAETASLQSLVCCWL